MDTKKMRVCAPLLEAPGDTVVIECLDEIDKLRAALRAIVEQCGRYGGIPPMRTRWERIKELANKASDARIRASAEEPAARPARCEACRAKGRPPMDAFRDLAFCCVSCGRTI
jgi:hypothetical protein